MSDKLREFTDEQIAEFREAFEMFDQDGDGHITCDELGTVLKSLDISKNESELREMIKSVDVDGSGMIEFEEFLDMMRQQMENGNADEGLRDVFDKFDKDGSGFICIDELQDVMTQLGQNLTREEIQEMINDADIDGDGEVSYEEFVKLFHWK